MELNVSATFPARPVQEPGRRTEKSPSLIVCRLARIALSSPEARAAAGSSARAEFPLRPDFGLSSDAPDATAAAVSPLLFFIKISLTAGGARRLAKSSLLGFL